MAVGLDLQWPAPSQAKAPTDVSPSQFPAWQMVLEEYLRQPPVPSHVPSVPHPLGSCLAHVAAVRGSDPAVIDVHVPSVSVSVQLLQPLVQAESQQTPSTQKPLAQSLLHPQVAPLTLRAPPTQTASGAVSFPPSAPSPWSIGASSP